MTQIIGSLWNDTLTGGWGNDTLDGFGASGSPQVDVLTGGGGADLFILDNGMGSVYYLDPYGNSHDSYAIITDYSLSQGDAIQLFGGYSLDRVFNGTDIYYGNDLIAVVENVNPNEINFI